MVRPLAAALIAVLVLVHPAMAQDAAEKAKAKELVEKYQDAIVTVKLVSTTRYAASGGIVRGGDMHKNDQKNEITGTVINADGLTVLSNYATNPSAAFEGFSYEMDGEKIEFKPETTINEVKIVLADGTEIDAQQVLSDKDLDLAFVRPKEKPAKPFAFVPFAKPSAEPDMLDKVLTIGRLGRQVNRVPSVSLGAVSALVKKPRTFYITDLASGFTSMGCPVFNLKGETLGLAVMRQNPVKGGGAMGLFGGMQPVVLPSDDLLDVAKQAAAKQGETAQEKNSADKKAE